MHSAFGPATCQSNEDIHRPNNLGHSYMSVPGMLIKPFKGYFNRTELKHPGGDAQGEGMGGAKAAVLASSLSIYAEPQQFDPSFFFL